MSLSFAFTSKSRQRPAASAIFADETSVAVAPSNGKYIREFDPAEAPPETEHKVKPIPPLLNEWLARLQRPRNITDAPPADRAERIKRFRESLEGLQGPGYNDYDRVPVEGFGAAVLAGYGHTVGKEEDVKAPKVVTGRWGVGYTGDPNGKTRDEKEKRLDIGKEVRIVNGRMMGMKGKVVEVRKDGEILVLRLSRNCEKVTVRSKDVAELGSVEEDKCLRKLKELKTEEENSDAGKGHRNSSRKTGQEDERMVNERVNWLRNHIRVRIICKDLKGGRLFLKGVVVDVVGPGVCDVSMDEGGELIQGAEQKFLETVLPRCGGPIMILCGRYKGVYGILLERESEEEMGWVRDADTHEMLNVRLDQIAEYTGDPSDIGY